MQGKPGIIPAFTHVVNDCVIAAPVHLDAQTRAAFREEALVALSRLGDRGDARLVVDLSRTGRIDSAGLGTLVMIQQRASERKHGVLLKGVSEEIRFLLLMTRLDDRFTIEGV